MAVLSKYEIEHFSRKGSEPYQRITQGWSGFDFRDLLDTIAHLYQRIDNLESRVDGER